MAQQLRVLVVLSEDLSSIISEDIRGGSRAGSDCPPTHTYDVGGKD